METPKLIREEIEGRDEDLMIVGHLPHLGVLTAALLETDEDQSDRFPSAGLVFLEQTGGTWKISQ